MDEAQTKAWLDTMEQPGPMKVSGARAASGMPISGDTSISGGMLAGNNADNERAFFQRMRDTFGGNIDPTKLNESDLEKYLAEIKDHPSVGMFIVSRLSQRKSGWTPTPDSPNNTPEKFATYLDILGTAPCVMATESHHQEISYREEDYNELIDKATDALKEMIDGDVNKIIEALRSLAKAATSNKRKESTDTLFAQNVVAVDVDKVGYDLFLTRATMKWSEDGKAHVYESSLTIYTLKLEFSTEDWKMGKYRQIGTRYYNDDEHWLDDVKTPLGTNMRKLCIEAA